MLTPTGRFTFSEDDHAGLGHGCRRDRRGQGRRLQGDAVLPGPVRDRPPDESTGRPAEARATTSQTMLTIDRVSRRFGGVYANQDVTLEVRRGGAARDHRAQRRRQVDALQPDRGPRPARQRGDPPGRRAGSTGCRRTSGPAWASASCSRAPGLFAGMSLLENVMVGAHARTRAGLVSRGPAAAVPAPRGARIRAQAEECLERVGLARAGPRGRPTGCRSGSSGGSRSPGRSPGGRGCCCWTSRPPACGRPSGRTSPS